LIYDLGNRQWDIPKLRELLEDTLLETSAFNDFEVEHDFETIGRKIMHLNARRIDREANQTQLILLAIEDVTEREYYKRHLEEKVAERTSLSKNPYLGHFTFDRFRPRVLFFPSNRSLAYSKCYSVSFGAFTSSYWPFRPITSFYRKAFSIFQDLFYVVYKTV